jgi:diguanylate cyclase (GGDEF)-like protein
LLEFHVFILRSKQNQDRKLIKADVQTAPTKTKSGARLELEQYLNTRLQATEGLNAQESRLAGFKRRAYLLVCLAGFPGILVGFLSTTDSVLRLLFAILLLCTAINIALNLNARVEIGQIERLGFWYSAVFILSRAAYSLFRAQNEIAVMAVFHETYSSIALIGLMAYIMLNTRTALRAALIVFGIMLTLNTIKLVSMPITPTLAELRNLLIGQFSLAGAFLAFSYVLALTKDLLAVEQIRSSTDPLTGAANRWQMYNSLEREWLACQNQKRTFGVILLDIDHFKSINDLHGHHAGDTVLQELTKVFQKSLGNLGSVGRWGGEEFLILLPHATLEQARVQAETLKASLAKHKFKTGQVTASFGVASLLPKESTNELMRRADENLYSAKLSGRNRVEIKARVLQEFDLEFQDPRATKHS